MGAAFYSCSYMVPFQHGWADQWVTVVIIFTWCTVGKILMSFICMYSFGCSCLTFTKKMPMYTKDIKWCLFCAGACLLLQLLMLFILIIFQNSGASRNQPRILRSQITPELKKPHYGNPSISPEYHISSDLLQCIRIFQCRVALHMLVESFGAFMIYITTMWEFLHWWNK